jgi:hypothetical protein
MRAPWTEALARIEASGDRRLASSDDFNVGKSVAHFNANRGAGLDLVAPDRLCAEKPSWYVVETRGDGEAEPALTLCQDRYLLESVFNRAIPSQLPWALYRREQAAR